MNLINELSSMESELESLRSECRILREGKIVADFEIDQLRRRNLNVQETENVVFAGAESAVARINVDGQPDAELLRAIESGSRDILGVQVVKI